MRKKMDHLPPTASGVAYQIEAFGGDSSLVDLH